jgi:hypothetical protein
LACQLFHQIDKKTKDPAGYRPGSGKLAHSEHALPSSVFRKLPPNWVFATNNDGMNRESRKY